MSTEDNRESNHDSTAPVNGRFMEEKSEAKPRVITEIETSALIPHHRNQGIYGKEDVSDLVDLIKERGHIVNSLVVNQDNVIISGHRRWMAAKEIGYATVPCEVIEFDSEEDELEALIHYNASREKTFEAKVREGLVLEDVYSVKAEKRRMDNLKQNNTDMAKSSISEDSVEEEDIKGATRDVVAVKTGIPSGKTYERAKKVILEADRLREKGREDDAELLIYLLNNKSVSSTADLADETILESLPLKTKQELRNGKVSVRSVVPKSKDNNSKNKTKNEYDIVKNHIKVIATAAKELKNSGIVGNTNKQTQKIREDIEAIISNLQELLCDDAVNTQ